MPVANDLASRFQRTAARPSATPGPAGARFDAALGATAKQPLEGRKNAPTGGRDAAADSRRVDKEGTAGGGRGEAAAKSPTANIEFRGLPSDLRRQYRNAAVYARIAGENTPWAKVADVMKAGQLGGKSGSVPLDTLALKDDQDLAFKLVPANRDLPPSLPADDQSGLALKPEPGKKDSFLLALPARSEQAGTAGGETLDALRIQLDRKEETARAKRIALIVRILDILSNWRPPENGRAIQSLLAAIENPLQELIKLRKDIKASTDSPKAATRGVGESRPDGVGSSSGPEARTTPREDKEMGQLEKALGEALNSAAKADAGYLQQKIFAVVKAPT